MNETHSYATVDDKPQDVATDDIVIRTATSKELSEVVKPSWITAYTRSVIARWMRADARHAAGRAVYWSSMQARVEKVFSTSTTSVRIAWIPPQDGEDGEGIVAGWVCDDQRRRILHYAYVRQNFQRQGIGRRLYGWIEDQNAGLAILRFLPPPWFTKPDEQTGMLPWKQHQIIDLVSVD